jgi:uncharacterized protein (TIGR03083 family)
MIPERDVDCGQIYEAQRNTLLALLRSRRDDELSRRVPATPAWSVSDALSHVVGITADLNAGRLSAASPEEWTAAQVHAREHQTVEERAREWDLEAPRFEEGLRLLGYEIGSHYVGDLLQHVSDIRHALGAPLITDDEALAVALDFYLVSFEQSLEELGLGTVDVTVDDEHWLVGAGATIALVTAPRYELFRALGGRRSEDQIRSLDWSGDVDAVVPVVSRYPLPQHAIIETGSA